MIASTKTVATEEMKSDLQIAPHARADAFSAHDPRPFSRPVNTACTCITAPRLRQRRRWQGRGIDYLVLGQLGGHAQSGGRADRAS